MKNKISLLNITKSFDGMKVLDGFSAEITENSAIMGASGEGKTTLIRIIMGLTKPDSGSVSFEKTPEFSAVFQEDRLFGEYSALENVAAVCGRNISKKDAKALAGELLDELLIEREEQTKSVRDFSGGMKRRVAVARALAASSDVLILDEPYKGLDDETRKVCAECIKKHSENKLVLLITHDIREADLSGIENIINLNRSL